VRVVVVLIVVVRRVVILLLVHERCLCQYRCVIEVSILEVDVGLLGVAPVLIIASVRIAYTHGSDSERMVGEIWSFGFVRRGI